MIGARASVGWPWAVTRPGLPQIRTCGTTASGSSCRGLAGATLPAAISGRCRSSSWSRSSFLTTVPRHGEPFPPTGPGDTVPRLHRYYGSLRLLDARPASLRFLRSAVPRMHPLAPRGRRVRLPRRDLDRRSRLTAHSAETSRSPRFLGNPHACMPCSQTPARLAAPGHRGAANVAFRLHNDVGPRESHFGAPSHGLHTRCLRFAARVAPGPRKTRFRLAGQPCPGGVGYPQDSRRGFSSSSTSTRLALAHYEERLDRS